MSLLQQNDQWYADRLGHVTASRVADIMPTAKGAYGATRKNYMMQLLCERLTGAKEDTFTSNPMQRGIELEAVARGAYEARHGLLVQEVGFIKHPNIPWFGASPDGLVDDDGGVEIKCPNTAQHVEFLRTRKPDQKYIIQMHTQMMCAERDWIDFISYDDRLPESLAYSEIRINLMPPLVTQIAAEVTKFLDELHEIELTMRKMM